MDQLESVRKAQRQCARADFQRWSAALAFRDSRVAELDRDAELSPMARRMAVNAIALELAQAMRVSEQAVWRLLERARRLKDRAPVVWAAFATGMITEQKVVVVASALERVANPETAEALDAAVVTYAETHTPGEVRRWADRLIDRLEPLDIDAADAAREKRGIEILHGYDGMSWINAHVPTVAAAAIARRLRSAATQYAKDHPDDERLRHQREADLFVAWLTNAEGTACDIAAEVAVVVEATALAGVTDTPAVVDDEGSIPARWVLELADEANVLWTRLLTDPRGRVLDVTHLGYQPPESLRHALRWRDMTCRVNGCSARARDSDLDHVRPFDAGGATTAANLRTLCRRHHGMKGHGVLPADAYEEPAQHIVRIPPSPLEIVARRLVA